MSFLTLYTGERGWIATDKRVYAADEIPHIHSVIDQLQHLNALAETQQQRIDEAIEAAHNQGYQEGLELARIEASSKALATLNTLQANFEKRLDEQQDAIVSVSLDVVRKIAGKVAPADWLLAEATQAVGELTETAEPVQLHVAVEHADVVRERLRSFRMLSGMAADQENTQQSRIDDVVADDALQGDDCVLFTPFGSVAVDLDTQLAEISSLLKSQALNDG